MAESEARVWRAWSTTRKEFKAKVKRRHWKALTGGVNVLHFRKITQATEWTTIWSGTKVTPWAPVAATQPRRGGDFTFQGSGPGKKLRDHRGLPVAGLAGLPDGQLWGRAVCSLLVRVPISDARLPLLYDHRIITLDHGPTPESSREGEGFL